MGTLLGANFKKYVVDQISTRQSILGDNLNGGKPEDQIVWENNNTSYIALVSSIDIKDNPIITSELSVSINSEVPGGTIFENTLDTNQALLEAGGTQFIISQSLAGENVDFNLLALANRSLSLQYSFLPLLEELPPPDIEVGTPFEGLEYTLRARNIIIKGYRGRDATIDMFSDLTTREYALIIYKATKGSGTFDRLLATTLESLTTVGRFKQVEAYWPKINDETQVEDLRTWLSNDGIEIYETDDGYYEFSGSKVYNNIFLFPSVEVEETTATFNLTSGGETRTYISPYSRTSAYISDEFGARPEEIPNIVQDAYNDLSQTAVSDATYVAPNEAQAAIEEELYPSETPTPPLPEFEIEEILTDTGKTDGLGIKRIQSLDLDGDPNQYLGDFVARNLVLTNGTTLINDDGSKSYKAGVADDLSIFNNYVYGFGGDSDWGLTAMPGLQSVDVKSTNMGSLREATVKIRANSEKQFALIDAIYCRIGYTMFLEWGHSIYYDNKSQYQSNPLIAGVPSLVSNFIKKGKNKSAIIAGKGLQKQIETNREISCGNYDAFVGKVTNFSWEFNKKGYYEINLKIKSIGDIIESLAIDQISSNDLNPNRIPATGTQPSNGSTLENFLTIAATPNGVSTVDDASNWFSKESIDNNYGIFKNTLVAQNEQTINEVGSLFSSLVKTQLAISSGPIGIIYLIATDGESIGFNPGDGLFGDSPEIYRGSSASDLASELNYDRSKTNSAGKIISGRAGFGNDIYYYIRFGDILDFIKDRLLIYNPEDNNPIIGIDTNTDLNLCYYSGVNVSADPSKVMVSAPLPLSLEELKGFAQQQDKNGEYNWSYGVYQDSIFKQEDAFLEPFVIDQAEYEGSTLQAGRIMNIYFEYQYLLNTIQEKRNEETSSLNLFDFLKSLLETANNCLGGINKLSLRLVEDNILEIYDQVPLYGSQKPASPKSIINLYGTTPGNGSFVKDFNIKTELTNDFATQVTIGAQAQGSKDTTDALALSNWNYGLQDRWFTKKISASEKDGNKSKPASIYENLLKARNKVAFLWLGYSQGLTGQSLERELTEEEILNFYRDLNLTTEDEEGNETADKFDQIDDLKEQNLYYFENFPTKRYSEFVKLQKDFLSLLHINSDYNSNQMGMLPMNISVTLNGLSGIRIFDQLPVDVRFIPNYYPQTLHWIIKGVSHSISNNKWVTNLETIAVPKIPSIPSGKTATSSTKIKDKSYTLLPKSDIIPTDVNLGPDNRGNASLNVDVTGAPTVPVSKKPLVEKIVNLIKNNKYNKSFTDRGYMTAILGVALGESSKLNFDASESFIYDLNSAKTIFSKIRALSDEEALKYIPPSKGGSGSQEKLANFLYGGKYNNGPNEGYKYRGQGLTQITFKSNYEGTQKDIIDRFDIRDINGKKVDIVTNPEKVRDENVSISILVYGKLLGKYGKYLSAYFPSDYLTSGGKVQKLQNGSNGRSTKTVPSAVTKNYIKAVARVNNTPWIQELINPNNLPIPEIVTA